MFEDGRVSSLCTTCAVAHSQDAIFRDLICYPTLRCLVAAHKLIVPGSSFDKELLLLYIQMYILWKREENFEHLTTRFWQCHCLQANLNYLGLSCSLSQLHRFWVERRKLSFGMYLITRAMWAFQSRARNLIHHKCIQCRCKQLKCPPGNRSIIPRHATPFVGVDMEKCVIEDWSLDEKITL